MPAPSECINCWLIVIITTHKRPVVCFGRIFQINILSLVTFKQQHNNKAHKKLVSS